MMWVSKALRRLYKTSGFKLLLGIEATFVDDFVGSMRMPLPNVRTRQKTIKYHDMHHVVTGYSANILAKRVMAL